MPIGIDLSRSFVAIVQDRNGIKLLGCRPWLDIFPVSSPNAPVLCDACRSSGNPDWSPFVCFQGARQYGVHTRLGL